MKKGLLFLLVCCTAGLLLFLQIEKQHLHPKQREEGLFGFLKDLILKSGAEEPKVGRKLKSKLFLNKSRETVTKAFISFCRRTNRNSPQRSRKLQLNTLQPKIVNLKCRFNSIESKWITEGEHGRGEFCAHAGMHV